MKIILLSNAVKQYKKINEPTKSRIDSALIELALEPPKGDIKKLKSLSSYRLRVGNYRLIFKIRENEILISHILPRGQVYKGGLE